MDSNGDNLKQVKDLKYVGLRMESTERDMEERKAPAWKVLTNLKRSGPQIS